MKERIKIGYVGLGRRGFHVLKNEFLQMKDVEIKTICDLNAEKMQRACDEFAKSGAPAPATTTDYRTILCDPEIDAVVIMIGWSGRPQIAMESMRAGKYTAIEVGEADTLDECYELIRTYEETGTPLMMLENCCYGRREMMALRMAREGLLGELVHCTGGYLHYLNECELLSEVEGDTVPHYRLAHYEEKNRENYPTHELGPIAKVLGINRGNRMVSLTAVASKARGIAAYAAERFGKDSSFATRTYRQGDIVNTVITCANGETIALTLDTTLPRAYYSRDFSVRGTRGLVDERRQVVFVEGMKEEIANNEQEMYEKYDHPLHEEYVRLGERGGHGGMDWLVCRAFVESVKRGENTPIDAYDTVALMAIGPLSERSIAAGGAPVEIPDFTGGKWKDREPAVLGKYCLDAIVSDPDTPIFPE